MNFTRIEQFIEFHASKIVVNIAKRTFFNSIRYVEHQEIMSSAEFIKANLGEASLFVNKKGGYFQFVMSKVLKTKKGLWFEFGVREGHSAKFFASFANKFGLNSKLYAFDSFEGLRNVWSAVGVTSGSFQLNKKPPKDIKNCEFIIGWIEDTLDEFLDSHPGPITFVHFDLDVYQPTKFALEAISNRLIPGSIIMFDEFHGYPGWKFHEKRALEETIPSSKFKFIAFGRKQACIQII
jgi:hypothetical protein